MPKLLTQGVSSEPGTGRSLIGIVAGFKSERWPASDRNPHREMRDQVGIPESKAEADPAIDLQTTAAGIERRTREEIKAALLDAADMIRILRIILDGKE